MARWMDGWMDGCILSWSSKWLGGLGKMNQCYSLIQWRYDVLFVAMIYWRFALLWNTKNSFSGYPIQCWGNPRGIFGEIWVAIWYQYGALWYDSMEISTTTMMEMMIIYYAFFSFLFFRMMRSRFLFQAAAEYFWLNAFGRLMTSERAEISGLSF